jgi:hypothetical protein
MWALQKGEKVLGLEHDIRVDPHHDVIVYTSLERLLVRTLEHVTSETLGPGKVNNARVLLRNHNLVSAVRGLHQKIRPSQEKLA